MFRLTERSLASEIVADPSPIVVLFSKNDNAGVPNTWDLGSTY